MVPIKGNVHLAYIPVKKVVGISKLARTVDIFARRLQTQETMTQQIANCIDNFKPGSCCVHRSRSSMTTRGRVLKPNVSTITSSFLGEFKSNSNLEERFISFIGK